MELRNHNYLRQVIIAEEYSHLRGNDEKVAVVMAGNECEMTEENAE